MRDTDRDEIRGLPLLAGMAPESVETLLRPAFLQRFPGGVDLIGEGEPADFLHLIVEGKVEVFARHNGRETTVSVLRPGRTFILAAVITDRPNLKSVRSLMPCRILMMPAEVVRQVFATDVAFARNLTLELAAAYRDVVKELKNQKLRPTLERLANWLLREDIEQDGRGRIELPFEKKVLAARLGVAPEVLSRTFGSLRAYGVAVDGKTITLGDVAALRSLAKPTELIDDPDY
jgi:CRP/FNR family transcriptional regulator, transcriptional activator FtrB